MDRRTVTGLLFALLLLLFAAAALNSMRNRNREYTFVFPVMGTVCQCTFEIDKGTPEEALSAVNDAFAQVMQLANLRDRQSELSILNASAAKAPFVCSEEMYHLLCASRRAHRISDGWFDISVKPLMDLWGFYRKRGKTPSAQEIAKTKALCGLEKVKFNDAERSVFFSVSGMAFDLGGIAKGYALDLAVKNLSSRGIVIRRGTIDLGGNIRLLGDRQVYRIGIKDPSAPDRIREVVELVSPGAVSSSGDYERYVVLDGRKFGHIIDPFSGTPAPRDHAATVYAPDGITSDWSSTVIYLAGKTLPESVCGKSWIIKK